jgi:type I restriction enzyme S subunit
MNESAVRLNETKPLPDGWRWVNLGEVCEEANTHDPRICPDIPFRYIDISSIDPTYKRITEARVIVGKDAPSRARQVVKANDVLVATTRPNLNAVALVPAELDDEICSTGFCVLRPANEIDPLFLFYFVQTNDFVRLVSGEVRGMLYPAVTDNHVHAINIPLPPLPEQKRIATKIQELMTEVEHARTACEAQLEAARALPQTYLRQVFESEEAKRWEMRKLGELGFVCDGDWILAENFRPSGVRLIQVGNIGLGEFINENSKFISKDRAEELRCTYVLPSDVLVSRMPEPIGRACIVPPLPYECITAVDCTIIHVNEEEFDRQFLIYRLNSPTILASVASVASGATRQRISRKNLQKIELLIPPLSEQERIAAELKDKIAGAEKLKTGIEKQLEAIKSLPQTILRKAFRGGL